MRIFLLIPLTALLAACAIPFRSADPGRAKAPCDRLAAQAIQTTSLAEAKTLAAQASECYAQAQER